MPRVNHVGLVKRGSRYYFRLRIPKDLQTIFRRNEVLKSLRTGSSASAKIQAKGLSYRLEQLFMQVRCGMLTREQIKHLIHENLTNILAGFEESRDALKPAAPYNPAPKNTIDVQESRQMAEYLSEWHQEQLIPGQDKGIGFAFDFLKDKGLFDKEFEDLTEDELGLVRFASRELRKSFVTVFKTERERLAGNYDNPYDSHTLKAASVPRRPVPLFSEAMERFLAEKRARGRTEKTLNEFDRQRRLYLKILGDKPVDQYERADFVRAKGILEKWPRNANALSRRGHAISKYNLDGLSTEEIIKRADLGAPYDTRTVHKHLEAINSTFKFCVTSGWLDRSLCPSWKEPEKEVEEKMQPFSQEEITRFFSSSLFSSKSKRVQQPETLWAFVIAVFSGLRIGEIVQLAVEDVFQYADSDLWCFDINAEGEKTLKNKSSKRVIPVHPQLLALGFLNYVERARARGQQWLWPGLKKDKGFDSDGFSKRVNRDIDRHCAKDKRKRFHSFRDTFAHALTAAGVDSAIIGGILGHTPASKITEKYMGKYPPSVMLEYMGKVQYEFDFSSLKTILPVGV